MTIGIIVALPLVLLLINGFRPLPARRAATYGLENWAVAFADPATLSALWNSVALGAVRTAISLPLAVAVAWLIARSDMPGRGLIEMLCWLGIFLPALPLTFGWILLLDPQYGLVNQWLGQLPFVEGSVFNVYSFLGITWVHLASSSIYYKVVLLVPAFRRVGASLEEAARMCGASQLTTTLRVTIPCSRPRSSAWHSTDFRAQPRGVRGRAAAGSARWNLGVLNAHLRPGARQPPSSARRRRWASCFWSC